MVSAGESYCTSQGKVKVNKGPHLRLGVPFCTYILELYLGNLVQQGCIDIPLHWWSTYQFLMTTWKERTTSGWTDGPLCLDSFVYPEEMWLA